MDFLGVKFAPLNVPLKRRLQTLAAAAYVVTCTFGGGIGALVALYLVLYTRLRWVVLLYLFWMYYIDRDVCETGGRINHWVRTWEWWKYLQDYFPLELVIPEGVHLDPKKNYLCGCFPHGLMPTGAFNAFCSDYGGFKKRFPRHETYVATLPGQFVLPFCRELILWLGGVSSSVKSLEYILSKPGGGNALSVSVGGAREAYNCKPGTYRLVLKHRKGFVKIALRTGAALVPVISFGETDLYDQLEGPWLRKFQEALRKRVAMAPIIPIGRGFFQYSFGLIPRSHPVRTVLGKPIDIPKIRNPTQEEINQYHSQFIEKLTELFEEHKHKYVKDPEKTMLIIE